MPSSPSIRMASAPLPVAQVIASSGDIPMYSTSISSSRACHSPTGVTAKPVSDPVRIFTPAACALASMRAVTSISARNTSSSSGAVPSLSP